MASKAMRKKTENTSHNGVAKYLKKPSKSQLRRNMKIRRNERSVKAMNEKRQLEENESEMAEESSAYRNKSKMKHRRRKHGVTLAAKKNIEAIGVKSA
jgi:hypothetical protein